MPASTRYSRPSISGSPPLSFSPTLSHATAVGQQKLNIVMRVVIEGRAERGANGAAIKMYLKISLPLDSITPGATIPLFPEENLKILESIVHPLDANSSPYNFPSKETKLPKAARALNLPARLSQTYASPTASTSSSEEVPKLEEKYTGQISVSAYYVSYILPKEFPRRETDPRSKRPSSIAQFMAAIDMWVPFISQPPHAPYLLSVPVPRCLSNHIKLKIFPPHTSKPSSSLASLSSADEDASSWDLTSDPHVTRTPSARLSRSHSYNNFADDESSDASTSAGFSDSPGIQGSFPSSERIRIRWARPIKATQLPTTSDGRRRAGIREAKGDMSCTVLGVSKGKGRDASEGLVMRLQYEAACKSVWYPGVATLLGLDVELEAGDCDVSWVPGTEAKWSVNGGIGYTGYAIGPPPSPTLSRQPSMENPSIYVLPSSPDARGAMKGLSSARHDSSSSTSSLLRAPLPNQAVPDYSFESSSASTPVSSLASLPPLSSPERDRRSRAGSVNGRYTDMDTDYDEEEEESRPPKVPITIHLNMNDLQPPSKHDFKFYISGTVLVTPHQPVLTRGSRKYASSFNGSQVTSDSEAGESDLLVVPRFRVLYTDREYISCTVRNDANDSSMDVYNSTGDVRDAQTRKTVLQRGGQFKCGTDGARIALRPITRSLSPPPRGRTDISDTGRASRISHSRPRMPNGVSSHSHRDVSPSMLRQSTFMSTLRPPVRRDGPLMIPYVTASITPMLTPGSAAPPKYAVRVSLPAPTDEDMEWLEFGLALPRPPGTAPGEPPKVDIASASIEGVPVRVSTKAVVKPEGNGNAVPFGEASAKEWITWVKVHVGDAGGGKVDILYLVKGGEAVDPAGPKNKEKEVTPEPVILNALLPSFSLPVGQLDVLIPAQTAFNIGSYDTNLTHEQPTEQGRKLSHYSMDEYFYPKLVLTFLPSTPGVVQVQRDQSWSWPQLLLPLLTAAFIAIVALAINLRQTQTQLSEALRSGITFDPDRTAGIKDSPPIPEIFETITVTATTTVVASGSSKEDPARWYYSPPGSPQEGDSRPYPPPDEATPSPPVPASDAPTPASPLTAHIPTLTPTPLVRPEDEGEISRFREFFRPIAIRLELPNIELPPFQLPDSANRTFHQVLDSFDKVYRFMQRVYHWPLPPP
ncbi:hypothetical protein GSI_14018 [Ganoderma sinense ZZ0214-1]|uniref:Uncharacterized protein n=1 Tax=Ganoderma sinense ZZ0214-1 TaxID=1077348 RepID=A0A2G8RRX7_9APHY|nr:hypothetical protein GSI_14018 [Ganoderma sinense ZZ0214-1]